MDQSDKLAFPFSDHMPTVSAVDFGDDINITFGTFNILYRKYLQRHKKSMENDQQLKHVVHLSDQDLETGKDIRIKSTVVQTHNLFVTGASVVGIQECSQKFIDYFKAYLNKNPIKDKKIEILDNWPIDGEQIVIYDSNLLENIEDKNIIWTYPKHHYKILDIFFVHKETGKQFRFLNTHIPFRKWQHFAEYLSKQDLSNERFVMVGDFNCDPDYVRELFKKYGMDGMVTGPSLTNGTIETFNSEHVKKLTAYTHKNTKAKRVIYDHILHTV